MFSQPSYFFTSSKNQRTGKLILQLFKNTKSQRLKESFMREFFRRERKETVKEYTGKITPWPRGPERSVPSSVLFPDYATHPKNISICEEHGPFSKGIRILKASEISKMRIVCKLAREVLDEVAKIIRPGITTDEIDELVHNESIKRECYPSPLHYYGFPRSVCTSINEVICHGIPDTRPLECGDIVNVDITLYKDGFHGDLSETFIVGNTDENAIKLIRITHECLMSAIKIVKPGVPYLEIGSVIQKHANNNGFSVVAEYTGHGIHSVFHAPPNIIHCKNSSRDIIQEGHTFTIEPMINEGSPSTHLWKDNWTVTTIDGKRSAQFEQTLLVTSDGCEILTGRSSDPSRPYFEDQL